MVAAILVFLDEIDSLQSGLELEQSWMPGEGGGKRESVPVDYLSVALNTSRHGILLSHIAGMVL